MPQETNLNVSPYFDESCGVALVATAADRVVGFVLARRCGKGEADRLIPRIPADCSDISYADAAGTLGVIKTIAVAPDKLGCGVGKALFCAAEGSLTNLGVNLAIVPAWFDGKGVNIAGLMKAMAYQKFTVDRHYWKQECEAGIFLCPSKSKETCVCGVEFYKRKV